ncbi:hypothetical protein G7Y89_g13962 [Cudoniella acicularis]|uniref:Uncharacterized protein n=1 Tax=Cudoniella acicularis TaxID=354080 RepID=A0A8H4VY62_9HELO|nr:hypothetical protein G7Y89_g13962 [Cudoniella acicularis]
MGPDFITPQQSEVSHGMQNIGNTDPPVHKRMKGNHRVKHNVAGNKLLQSDSTRDESGIFYIDINATYLMFVTSSTQKFNQLFTPYQYYLGLGLVEAASIEAVETATGNYSYTLPANCFMGSNTYDAQGNLPCSIVSDIKGGTLVNPLTSPEVLNNISLTIVVNTYEGTKNPHAFLGVPGNGVLWNQYFAANTYSASTQCTPVLKECGISRNSLTSGVSVPFACPQYPAFQGDIIADTFVLHWFNNSSGTQNTTIDAPTAANPVYFGANGHTDRAAGVSAGLMADPEVVALEYGGLAYIMLGCSMGTRG